MNTKQNLHTHTTFCDGKNTPEEMIAAALSRGFGSLGFSIHCDPSTDGRKPEYPQRFHEYKKEILRLKEKYRGVLDVFLGIEYDAYSDQAELIPLCDYAIGSVHYLKPEGTDKLLKMDVRTPELLQECINAFGGDPMKMAESYYGEVASLPERGRFHIIGHFDLLTKHNEHHPFLDVTSRRYQNLVYDTLRSLAGKIPFFEVNTGAIPRNYRTEPYPEPFIIKIMKELGFGAIISSDTHNAETVDCRFEESRALLRECGYTSRYVLTTEGFTEIEL